MRYSVKLRSAVTADVGPPCLYFHSFEFSFSFACLPRYFLSETGIGERLAHKSILVD